MTPATPQAIVDWLLSSNHVPEDLATRLTLNPPTPHPLVVWRFRGRWTNSYSGELGKEALSHTTELRDQSNPDGTVESMIDGVVTTSRMEWIEVTGEHDAPFDVVLVEGDAPEPPGAGFAAKTARKVVESEGQPAQNDSLWQGPGQQRVSDEVGVALRGRVGSPHVNRLRQDTQVQLSQTHQAPVVVLEFNGTLDGKELRFVVGADDSVWGSPPRDDARKEQLSSGSAKVVLAVLFWAIAAIVGLFIFVVPGVVAGIIGLMHVRSLLNKRNQHIDTWRDRERPAVTALVNQSLASVPPLG